MRPSSSFELSSRADSLTYLRAHKSIATRSSHVGVAGVPRPRTKHELFGCCFNPSIGITQMSISSIANCIGSGLLQRWVLLTLHGSSWQRRL